MPILNRLGYMDELTALLYAFSCIALWFILFFLTKPGFEFYVEEKGVRLRAKKSKPFIFYSYEDVKDFSWASKSRMVRSRVQESKTTNVSFTLHFSDGEEIEISEENFENFMLVRTIIINKLRRVGKIDFSWMERVREKEAKRREKFRR